MVTKEARFARCPCPHTDGFCVSWNGKGKPEDLSCISDVKSKDCPYWRQGHPVGLFVYVERVKWLDAIPDAPVPERQKRRR